MSESDIWEGTVLTVPNKHVKSCGEPPELAGGRNYTAYFENEYGEQLVFQYDRLSHKGTLLHGDMGWDDPREVHKGTILGVILSEEERKWLRLVWDTATRYPISKETITDSGNGGSETRNGGSGKGGPRLECPHCHEELDEIREVRVLLDVLSYTDRGGYYWCNREDEPYDRVGWEPEYSSITYACPECHFVIPNEMVEKLIVSGDGV